LNIDVGDCLGLRKFFTPGDVAYIICLSAETEIGPRGRPQKAAEED
jgi:hypothetical protein